jgi:hypothetical protein
MANRVPYEELTYRDTDVWHGGNLFTGTSVEKWPNGIVREEQDFDLGVRHGVGRAYDEEGRLVAEAPYRHGVSHGLARWWHENGRREQMAQFGIIEWERSYDDQGAVVDEYQLPEDSSDHEEIRRLREKHAADGTFR